eukprot:scaffold6425_cov134-Pinguiococcus_pyrenoidosus.AAC.1
MKHVCVAPSVLNGSDLGPVLPLLPFLLGIDHGRLSRDLDHLGGCALARKAPQDRVVRHVSDARA